MVSARVRSHKASLLYDRLWKQTKAYGDELYRKLNAHQDALREQGVSYEERRAKIKAEKALIDAELVQQGFSQMRRRTYLDCKSRLW